MSRAAGISKLFGEGAESPSRTGVAREAREARALPGILRATVFA